MISSKSEKSGIKHGYYATVCMLSYKPNYGNGYAFLLNYPIAILSSLIARRSLAGTIMAQQGF